MEEIPKMVYFEIRRVTCTAPPATEATSARHPHAPPATAVGWCSKSSFQTTASMTGSSVQTHSARGSGSTRPTTQPAVRLKLWEATCRSWPSSPTAKHSPFGNHIAGRKIKKDLPEISNGRPARYLASASRFSFAHALSFGTAFRGGPPSVPQEQGPSVFASVMHEQDFVFKQAQT